MFILRAVGLTLGLALLVACSDGHDARDSSVFQHLSIADNGDVIAYAHDGSTARVSATGGLEIAGKAVSVSPEERQLLQSYHGDALKLQKDGIATGAAGLRTGMQALNAVASGLASGNPDSIDAKVNAKADKVEALARAVCADLSRLYTDQGKLTTSIPSFRPYATIEQHEISDCHAD